MDEIVPVPATEVETEMALSKRQVEIGVEAERSRLWEHALHEDQLYGNKLGNFAAFEALLFIAGSALGTSQHRYHMFLVIAIGGIVLSVLWFPILLRHAMYVRYFAHHRLNRGDFPEYEITLEQFHKSHPLLRPEQFLVAMAAPVIIIGLWAGLIAVFGH